MNRSSRKPWEISRRTFLRGVGATLALPLLEQMLPSIARAEGAGKATRLVVFYIPNGMMMNKFTPAEEGENWTPTPMLEPLAPHKADILVLTNLANHEAKNREVVAPHSSGTASFLTAAKPQIKDGPNVLNATSMDQVAAQALRSRTRYPSLELGVDAAEGVGDCERTYACQYLRHISWSSPTTPVAKEVDPRAVFERLFGAVPLDPASAEKQKRRRQSVLDLVREDTEALQRKLGTADRRKLGEYLDSVREVETRIDGGSGGTCEAGALPGVPLDVRDHTKAMIDLMVLAMQCDLTRVLSFMLGNGRSKRAFEFLGIQSAYHNISHHGGNSESIKAINAIKHWEVEQFAYLLERMKAVQEADGTLLDNSLVYFGSEISEPNDHAYDNLPVVLAGRAGGQIKPGRHIRYAEEQSTGKLFVSMLATVGVDVPSFGSGVGPLEGLTG